MRQDGKLDVAKAPTPSLTPPITYHILPAFNLLLDCIAYC